MRNLKKFLALVLALMMTMSLMVTVNAAQSPADFGDISADSSDFSEAINVLSALGVINGYKMDDGSTIFNPKGDIKRSEVAAILYRVAANDAGDKQVGIYKDYGRFSDVLSDAWYAGAVNYCANSELVVGVGADRYAPHSKVTGYQVLAMALRMLGYDQNGEFEGSGWQIRTASYARQVGLTKNIKEGTLGANATREMVAEIIFQALQAPTVTYNMLTNYTPVKLVSQTKNNDSQYIYDKDVYNTLMYANYGIVGKRTILGSDNKYGRPMVEWVKDAKDDTVENGGKFIVNPQKAEKTVASATGDVYGIGNDNAKNKVDAGAVYIPRTTPGAKYAAENGTNDGYKYEKSKIDQTVLAIPMTPVYTFNKAMTECELSKAINNDDQISWSDITEYVNGGLVVNRNDPGDTGAATLDANFDALHTTNTSTGDKTSDYSIGAAGRQTEIYNLGDVDGDDNDEWIFVYIDTMLGKVVKVVPHTLDTNEHVVSKAELWIAVNDAIDGSTKAKSIVMTQDDNYTQKVDDLVTLTTWGLQDDTNTTDTVTVDGEEKIGTTGATNAIQVNYAILNAVPDGTHDATTKSGDGTDGTAMTNGLYSAFETVIVDAATGKIKSEDDKMWAVEFASKSVGEPATVPTTTITVNGTVGLANDKTGVIADGKTIPTTWAYHVDHRGVVQDKFHTDTNVNVNDDTTLRDLTVNVTNSIIGKTYTVALDKNGNILGMWHGKSDKIIGVVTDADYVRIGLGKYAVEMEVFTVDSKTETVRLLDASATNKNNYFPTQEEADDAIVRNSNAKLGLTFTDDSDPDDTDKSNLNPKGALVELTSYTKDGETYWYVSDSCTATTPANTINANVKMAGTQDTNGIVEPGKADTLVGNAGTGKHNDIQVNDETVFIVAEYEFDYSAGIDNAGKNINVRYTVYNTFRDIPVINGAYTDGVGNKYNVVFQTLDGKVDATTKEAKYVLISAIDPNEKYSISKPDTFNPDNSFLVIAPVATYAQYSEYLVARNGELDTIKVANINGTVNTDLQAAIRVKGLLVATSTNSAGYITAVDEVKNQLGGTGTNPNLGAVDISDTLITKNWGLKHNKGVLSWENSNADDTITPNRFLTVAANCVVRIVNVDNGQMYPATLDHIAQYQADHDIVFDVDANGWVNCLYIID